MRLIIVLLIFLNHVVVGTIENDLKDFYKDKSVLVTGGAGFIGSHIVDALVALDARVTVLDNFSSGFKKNIAHHQSHIVCIEGSITDSDICCKATCNKDIIFHLAAYSSVPGSLKNPCACHVINDQGTYNLLEAARINKVNTFIFSSSSAIYGNCEEPYKENHPYNPQSSYGYSKYIGELYCKEYTHLYGINTVILRYFNVYGERQSPYASYAAVVPAFKKAFADNNPITIYGTGQQTRDFISVDKVAQANIIMGMLAPFYTGEVFNIARGESLSILDLYTTLAQQYPSYNKEPLFVADRPGDVLHTRADVTKYNLLLASLGMVAE